MQTESIVEKVLKDVQRFRILCVGRAGVGKASLIYRVFGIHEALVADWNVGDAGIETEFTSAENHFIVVHYSEFEAGSTQSFDVVRRFIERRCDKRLPLRDRLHAVWLCTETPTAGGRVFETGDEKLVQLAQRAEIPIVVVFTKYDKLVRTKKSELQEDRFTKDLDIRSREEAQKALDTSVHSLRNAIRKMDSRIEMPPWAKVSIVEGYDADIPSLLEITSSVVQEKLKDDTWVLWAIAQRASLSLKINSSAATSTVYYRHSLNGDTRGGTVLLRDCLAEVHEAIITCWNFEDEDRILNSHTFRQLMLYLVQDVRESLNRGESPYSSSRAIDEMFQFLGQITTKSSTAPSRDMTVLPDWLKHEVLQSTPRIQLLLMAYMVDLTTVLISLFDTIAPTQIPISSGSISWSELKNAFDDYKGKGSLQRIHRRFCDIFQHDQQILGSEDSFRRTFYELVPTRATPIAPPEPTVVDSPPTLEPTAETFAQALPTPPPSASPLPSAQRPSISRPSALWRFRPWRSAPRPSVPAPHAPRPSKSRPSAPKLSAAETELHRASRMGHVDKARSLIKGNAKATAARDEHGWTPLHHASSRGHSEVVRLFLEHSTDAEATLEHDADAETSLEYGTDLSAQDKDGSTPLHVAAREGHAQVVRILLGRDGTDPKPRNNNPDAYPRDERNMTPLHLASMFGRLEVVQLLLDIEKNPNVENKDQQTPLFLASRAGRLDIVRLLLSCGAHSNHLDGMKRSPLHMASENAHFDVVELLIENEADVNGKDAHLWTPLHVASKTGKLRVAEALLRLGADVGAQNNLRQTPLHMASQEGHLELVQLLLDQDNVNIADGKGETALRRDIVNVTDGNRETALHLAAYYGRLEVTKLLLDRGAIRLAKNKNFRVPSDLASNRGHREIARLLT